MQMRIFAGCFETQRSTSGGHLCIEGPNTHVPLHALSKRQDSTATSTPEAEIVSASTVTRTILIPAMGLWEILLKGPKSQGILKDDNDAAIRVMTTGRNPTMKQVHRVHGVSIASLHEIVVKTRRLWCCWSTARLIK